MKTIKMILAAAIVAVGLIFFLTKCKKNTDVVVVQVHDTVYGKSISGMVKYPDYSGTLVKAPGTLVYLYLGTTVSGNPVATAYADTNGNYTFPYLLPNTYYLFAKYNTANNYKPIEGINFETDPTDNTLAVTVTNANVSKDINMGNMAPTGTKIITITAADTTGSMGVKDCLPVDGHGSLTWWTTYCGNAQTGYGGTETTLEGHFGQFNSAYGGCKLTKFYFDEATPANTYFKAWFALSKMSTNEPGRDGLANCVPKTMGIDTSGSGATLAAVPKTDTCWYEATAGQVQKYGKGYIVHGTMTAFYKSAAGEIEPPRVTACTIDSASWNGFGPSYAGPFSQMISKQVDMYLEYQGTKITWNKTGTTFNKWAVFEAQVDFKRSDFYVSNTSVGNVIHATPHIQLKGGNNVNW